MPWYAAGTITVAASGTTATGAGTAFLGNVRVGDGIAIQGSSSLHEVTGVTSDTQLTFAPPYAGAAGGGKAYRAVPVLGYDKDLSDAFNALRLEFGSDLANLKPWATAATGGEAMDEMGFGATGKDLAAAATPDAAMDELGFGATGKDLSGAETPAAARTVLQLGDAAIADVVGPMSSGAIIERGSNANGEYVRFADGTQICNKNNHRLSFASAYRLAGVWTFPAAFMGSITMSMSYNPDNESIPNVSTEQLIIGRYFSKSNTSINPQVYQTVGPGGFSSGDYVDVDLVAIGRWS